MDGSVLKAKLREGRVALGTWVTCADVAGADILAHVGFDFVFLDMEHAPLSVDQVQTLCVVFRDTPTVPLARVPWNDMVAVKRALDAGAEGVLVPFVCSAEEARRAVAACRYPPEGVRGVAPRGGGAFFRDRPGYIARANRSVVVIVQIEHVSAVERLDEILAVEGIDALFVGPADLAASMGHLGDTGHPEVRSTMERVFARARAAGVPAGTIAATADEALAWIRQGARVVTLGSDLRFLQMASSAMIEAVQRQLDA
ncbi:MAG TPA: aldolase/citrate lyase family protein [Chloroflexota bacterium]